MIRCISYLVALAALLAIAADGFAARDTIAPLVTVEKVYNAPEPIGRLTATIYVEDEREANQKSFSIDCDLFTRSIPSEGLSDLPRPDWNGFWVAYSLMSVDAGEWVKRPYLYLQVQLHGPIGETWQQTWATFHFDAEGNLTRRIKRFIPRESTNSIRVIWEDWPIGSDQSAEAVIDGALEN